MSKHIFIRPAGESDRERFARWSAGTKDNLCDAEPLLYRNTTVWCAYNEHGPIVYVPVQKPAMMEALAINPESNPIDVAVALKSLVQNLVTQCHIDGTGEIYFLCTEASTQKFAEKQAFEKLPWNVYRMKISSLEKPCESQL